MKMKIFYGAPRTGKTMKAMQIASKYNDDEVVFTD